MTDLMRTFQNKRREAGQALVEYALIFVLLALALAIGLAATGPAISNVFSNVICNVAGQNPCGTQLQPLNTAGGPNPFWATVTWVASNPQVETPFPTPPIQPPTAQPTVGNLLPTNTLPPTETPIPTATIGPSATPQDAAFSLPFNEPADTTNRWRLFENSVYLGGNEWVGRYYPSNNHTGTPTIVRNSTAFGTDMALNIDFNWGPNAPITVNGWNRTDNFSVRWVRGIQIPTGVTQLRLTTTADDRASLYTCSSQANAENRSGCTAVFTNSGNDSRLLTVTPGSTVWLAFEYVEDGGNASVRFNITGTGRLSPDDVVTTGECTWGQLRSPGDSNSRDWMFDENPRSDTWPAGQTCYLELRGWLDTGGFARPVLSWWDVWDLPAGITATVEVADYNSDRSAMNWRTIGTRTGGTNVRNYEWTRSQIALTNVSPALTSNRVALRYKLQATSGTFTTVRWYIDDIVAVDTPERTFTVGNAWSMDDNAQRADFITTGRWDLTTTRTHGGRGWEDSPNAAYDRHSQGGPRIHYIELAGLINLGTGTPAADFEGDTGVPMITFWHAYEIAPNTRLELQFTRDANDTTPDTWTPIAAGTGTPAPPGGLLVNNTTSSNMTDLVMKRVQIRLDQIPNYNTQPFRLRWAMIVPASASTAQGWWIDDFVIERFGGDKYTAYPFADGAENDNFTRDNWLRMGNWATDFTGGVAEVFGAGRFVTGRRYADSPEANYLNNTTTTMEMSRYIDLMYDTPANTTNPTTIGEPTPSTANINTRRATGARPTLTFWHQRDVNSGVTFAVDITTLALADNNPNSDAEWRTIWSYVAPSSNPNDVNRRQQFAWQRVEIDLRRALETALTTTWATVSNATSTIDDDIRIRFRLITGGNGGNGVWIDGIRLEDLQLPSHRLWGATPAAGSIAATNSLGAGNGVRFEDFIETASPTSLSDPYDRWYMNGVQWQPFAETGSNGDVARSGNLALHDSPQPGQPSDIDYNNDSFIILEMATIVDLRGVTAAQNPTLYYWQRYQTSNDDNFRLQVSVEDTASTTQTYDRIAGWGAWTTVNQTPYTDMGANVTRNNWQRQQILLNSYVNQRIRVRWVIDATNGGGNGDGWYIDNVTLAYNGNGAGQTTPIAVPFYDPAQSMANWIAEGTWGLGSDFIRGATASAELGSDAWRGYYISCRDSRIAADGSDCGNTNTYQNINQRLAPLPAASATVKPNYTATLPYEDVFDLNFYWPEAPMNNTLSGNTPNFSFEDQWSARFMREVDLLPGTYTFRIVQDDGLRITINDRTDTSITNTNNRIHDSWWGQGPDNLYTAVMTVNVPMRRILTVDYFESGGPGTLIMTIERERYSFTDSPNTQSGATFNIVNGPRPARTSLILNGYFNLTGLVNPRLEFYWLARQNDTSIGVDTSTDGGFTWSQAWQITDTRVLPWQDWQQQQIPLTTSASVMIRFRWATNGQNADGVYITDIRVQEP
jgi:Flp pilus assembly pilin Flp